ASSPCYRRCGRVLASGLFHCARLARAGPRALGEGQGRLLRLRRTLSHTQPTIPQPVLGLWDIGAWPRRRAVVSDRLASLGLGSCIRISRTIPVAETCRLLGSCRLFRLLLGVCFHHALQLRFSFPVSLSPALCVITMLISHPI